MPLDKRARGHIAEELWKLAYPQHANRAAIRVKVEVINECIKELERRGMMPAEAREQLAFDYGFPSGEALRKFLEKYKHRIDKNS